MIAHHAIYTKCTCGLHVIYGKVALDNVTMEGGVDERSGEGEAMWRFKEGGDGGNGRKRAGGDGKVVWVG